MRKTKIICTMGPACDSVPTLKELIRAGMSVARLNMAHGDLDEHRGRIQRVRQAASELGVVVPILMDIKGPEIRIGQLKDASYDLKTGDRLVLTTEQIVGDGSRVAVNYPGLPQDVQPGNLVLIDDGSIELRVETIDGTEVICTVLNNSVLKQRKGVNLPGVRTSLPGVTERDVMHIKFGIEENISIIAMSFVRNGNDVQEVRGILEQHGAGATPIISKIENEEGMTNFASILEASDGIMVARGDLGVEIPTEEVPIAQKDMIRACNLAGKPVITATQMLDSMQRNPRPTRAEVSDVANAVLDGSDMVMLSGETAAGKYPVESVTMMATIAERVEQTMERSSLVDAQLQSNNEVTEVLCQAVVSSANKLKAAAILTPTESGFTARMIAKYRPEAPIIAVTASESAINLLSMVQGVIPIRGEFCESTDAMIRTAIGLAEKLGYVKQGDLTVVSAGVPVGKSGTTNLLKVERV
ncbi:pyruvate kinase [Paenibacillus sp. GCM10023248]|uniref:pyruvate kinase n=1 Tax=Bacillales TaxID=1385 RepID=UPI002378CAAA|nr:MULTISPECIES: pyruvate kinase [Bacillales]MDD9270950.1 pyruvate kinase [Paenibacillus sp. MAHUQ-63]MDR6882915.1 pyruvate kinase [Bacillus sp. 3255]